MAKSLGFLRIPTLDPKGTEEIPSPDYVRAVVRSLNANFDVLNSAFGRTSQQAQDAGTFYQVTGTSLSVGTVFTQLVALNLSAGTWFIVGKGSHFDQNGNCDRNGRLFDATNLVSIDETYDNDDRALMRCTFVMMSTYTASGDWQLRLEASSSNAAGIRTVDKAVLVAWKIQEVL